MRSLRSWVIATVAVTGCATLALGDSWAPPQPRVFASQWGAFGFKVLNPKFGAASTGLLFGLDEQGKMKVLWEGKLVNTPHRVVVADDGKHVVTLDTYGSVGYAHSVVVYGDKGKVIADLKLEDLLTREEIGKHVPMTAGSRWWSGDAKMAIEGNEFVIRLNWGKTLKVSLETGKVSS